MHEPGHLREVEPPSPDVPEIRVQLGSISMTRPKGWLGEEKITFAADASGHGFVSATATDLSEPTDLATYVQTQGDLLQAQVAGYEHIGLEPAVLRTGTAAMLREFRWTSESNVMREFIVYAVVGQRAYNATATLREDLLQESRDLLLDTVLSLSVSDHE
jgi:hypothetical protein